MVGGEVGVVENEESDSIATSEKYFCSLKVIVPMTATPSHSII